MNNVDKQTKSSSGIIIFLSVITVILASIGAWKIFIFFIHAILASSSSIQAAVVGGSFTIFVSVMSVILSARHQAKREIQTEHRKQKSEIYEEFMQLWFRVLSGEKLGLEPLTEQELMGSLSSFTRRMIVWGSDEVLHEYAAFRQVSNETGNADPVTMMRSFERLLYAIRHDLGHANKNLGEKDLLRLFINDIDEYYVKLA